MFQFFKNIFNAIILVLVFAGINNLYNMHFFDNAIENITSFVQERMTQTVHKVGDFSQINSEFNVDTAVNLFGYKAVLAEHRASGQRMIVLSSGSKELLSAEDIKGSGLEQKLSDLSKKFKYQSSNVSDIQILERGYLYSYGKQLPYVKFRAKVTRLPINQITGMIAVNDTQSKEKRLLVAVNEKNRYSQLITNEFYKAVKESK